MYSDNRRQVLGGPRGRLSAATATELVVAELVPVQSSSGPVPAVMFSLGAQYQPRAIADSQWVNNLTDTDDPLRLRPPRSDDGRR